MKIAVWSPIPFAGRKSSNLLLMALKAIKEEGEEQLVIHTDPEGSGPEHFLLSGRHRSRMMEQREFGVELLCRLLHCERFSKEAAINAAYTFAEGKLHILPAGNRNFYKKGNPELSGELCNMIRYADEVFANVWIELSAGKSELNDFILSEADCVLVNLTQSPCEAERLNKFPKFKEAFYILGAYEQRNIYTVRNMQLLFPEIRGRCAVIPYHPAFLEACCAGEAEKFWRRGMCEADEKLFPSFFSGSGQDIQKVERGVLGTWMWGRKTRVKDRAEILTMEQLREYVKNVMRIYLEGEMPPGLRKEERKKYRLQVLRLRSALRACVYGEGGEKEYVKHYIMRELLALKLSIREKANLLPVNNQEQLTDTQRFRILLYRYMKQYGKDGFRKLCERWDLPDEIEREDGCYFEITGEDIRQIYSKEDVVLSSQEIMEILCDTVYEGFGHGIIDRLRDCRLEGISGGVAGIPEQFFRYGNGGGGAYSEKYSHDSVFVMINGNTVRLSFLSFGSEAELRRVIKALLRFEAPGELSYYRPYMVNDMKDGSRVFACRPPFSESWAFLYVSLMLRRKKRLKS